MLHIKDCNYAFAFDKAPYHVELSYNGNVFMENFLDDIDNCFLWAGYQIFVNGDYKQAWDTLRITDCENHIVHEIHLSDELLAKMWDTLTDIPVDENTCLEIPWFVFEKGTYNEDIWHWFDDRHSKGVWYLIYSTYH